MVLIDQINSHKFLYLDSLEESEDLKLEILIDEARIDGSTNAGETNYSTYGPISSDGSCSKYRITFEGYVAYSVLNESFEFEREDDEVSPANFLTFQRSKFLDYIRSIATIDGAESIAESSCQHFQLNCLNHVVNVATCYAPEIREIER